MGSTPLFRRSMSVVPSDTVPATPLRQADGRFPITVIVLTLDEETNIHSCLSSLDWVDELILVDSHSADDTVVRARRTTPRVRVFQNTFEDFGQQRNWALDRTSPRHEWILFFDADEVCTEECAAAIRAAVCDAGDRVGYYLCYRNFFLGRWIKRSTLFPTWQLRLMKKGRVRYRKEGHGQREVMSGSAGFIREPYDHFGFSKGVAHWIARHNEYSTNEVALIRRLASEPLAVRDLISADPVERRRALKRMAARAPLRPLARFIYLYVLRRGFLDGRPGLVFCLLRFAHEVHIVAKYDEALASKHMNASEETAAGDPWLEPGANEIEQPVGRVDSNAATP